jgi:quinoprotein glucose dehydrogenase
LRPGNGEHANSIVVLKAATGEVVWHFQTVHHELWDYDVASPPLLYPGRDGPAVAVGSKTGHVFLFDRLTGTPLFPIAERPVPASDVPGEQAAPTQPFPSKPVSLVPQQITEKDLWGATPADLDACRRIFRELRNEGVFTPPSLGGSLLVPGNIGGLHWGGIAWDAKNRLLIAPVNRWPAVSRLIPSAQFDAAKKAFPSRETTEQDGTPYAMSREFFTGPHGAPCIAPPWGELVAVRADDGEIAWRVPLGGIPAAKAAAVPLPLGSPNLGGPAATDTGLVFIGATLDAAFRAFDTRTGRELWKAGLPTSARATPLIYVTPRGRQMIAIAAGGHDTPLSRIDTKLVVFALK